MPNIGSSRPLYVIAVYATTNLDCTGDYSEFLEAFMLCVGTLAGPWLIEGDWKLPSLISTPGLAKLRAGCCAVGRPPPRQENGTSVSAGAFRRRSSLAVDVLEGSPSKTRFPASFSAAKLRGQVAVNGAGYPGEFLADKPLPTRPAPVETHGDQWPWKVGSSRP